MAVVVGDVTCTTGAAKRAYDAFNAIAPATSGVLATGARTAAQDAALRALIFACVSGILAEITANGTAVVTIKADATGDGLQRTPNPNNADTATTRPLTDKTIYGTLA